MASKKMMLRRCCAEHAVLPLLLHRATLQTCSSTYKTMYDSCMAKMPSTSAPDKPNTSRQGSLTKMFDSVTPYDPNSKRHGEIIAKDMVPLSTVTKPGFTALINTPDKRYSIPSRTYFSQTARPEMYKKCKEKVAV